MAPILKPHTHRTIVQDFYPDPTQDHITAGDTNLTPNLAPDPKPSLYTGPYPSQHPTRSYTPDTSQKRQRPKFTLYSVNGWGPMSMTSACSLCFATHTEKKPLCKLLVAFVLTDFDSFFA